jgi:hypothetical protein
MPKLPGFVNDALRHHGRNERKYEPEAVLVQQSGDQTKGLK